MHAIALDSTKAHKELGWMPTVDLREGIQRTIRWLCATLEPEPRCRAHLSETDLLVSG